MSKTKPTKPTAANVSRILADAGISKSTTHTTRVRGWHESTSGFRVSGAEWGAEVRYISGRSSDDDLANLAECHRALAGRFQLRWAKARFSQPSLEVREIGAECPPDDPVFPALPDAEAAESMARAAAAAAEEAVVAAEKAAAEARRAAEGARVELRRALGDLRVARIGASMAAQATQEARQGAPAGDRVPE